MGLTFYELWYSSIPKEFQWRNSDQFDLQENSHMEETSFTNKTGLSEQYKSVESHMADSCCQRDSDASIMNNKHISRDVVLNEDMEVGTNKRENQHQNFQPEGFYLNSEEQKGCRDPFSNSGGLTQDILYGLGMVFIHWTCEISIFCGITSEWECVCAYMIVYGFSYSFVFRKARL